MEINVTKNISGLKGLTKRYPEASQAARVSRIAEALLLLEYAVKLLTPVGAGPAHLRDTIFAGKPLVAGQSITGYLGTPAIYGEAVEFGTKPHFPPIEPIQFWVEKKLGIQGKEAKSVAFLIARKISKRGTEGADMFGKGFKKNKQKVLAILQKIPADIIRQVEAMKQ